MQELPLPLRNHLLSALSPDVCTRLFSNLERVHLASGQVLHERHDVMSHVYFPVDAVISLLYQTEHGAATEISVVGDEGMVGIALSIGGENLPSRAVVQRSGHAFRLEGALLKDEFDRHGDLLGLVLRYTQTLIAQMAQAAVCTRHHSIDQQLCRLLLLWLDHLPGNGATVPQELLGDRPGKSRTNMVGAADKLRRQGIIDYDAETITVLDRHQLEQLCCECYRLVKRESERLQPCVAQLR